MIGSVVGEGKTPGKQAINNWNEKSSKFEV